MFYNGIFPMSKSDKHFKQFRIYPKTPYTLLLFSYTVYDFRVLFP